MSYDGVMMTHVISEMRERLLKGRITKIYQLSDYDLLFQVRKQATHFFLMSTSPQYTRLHLTENAYDKPAHPPMFCMFLRKHLEGGVIERITQHDNDRVVSFAIKTTDDLGDPTIKNIIFEALGKDANIIVTQSDFKVLDAIKHTGPFEKTARTMVPGARYHYPEDARINPYDTLKRQAALRETVFDDVKTLVSTFQGISPLFAKELIYRAQQSSETFDTVFEGLLHEKRPTLLKGKKTVYAAYDLTHISGEKTPYDKVHALLDTFFYVRDQQDKRKQKAKDLEQFVKRSLERLKNKRENLEKDLAKTADFKHHQTFGELILAHQHQIEKGDRTLHCTNFYTDLPVDIPLDHKKNPIKNSEAYFKKSKKLKASVPYIKREIKKSERELAFFRLIESQLAYADLSDLEEIREELETKGYVKKRSRKKAMSRRTIDTYIDEKNCEIMVGKNNIQNGEITHKIAKHFHVWFHVQNAPGSHVVVKSGFPLEETTIRTAAHLAAYFSSMRGSSSVPVDYTEVKHIKKIPGKHDCFVRYTGQKTIYIDPDEAFIRTLKTLKK